MPDRATTALMMWAARSSGRTDANAPACRPTGVRRAVMIAARLCIRSRRRSLGPLVHRVLFARIGRLDDHADGLLVETFEAASALQVFEVASDRPFVRKFLRLLLGQQPSRPQPGDSLWPHGPALTLGERLLEEREIGKRRHRLDMGRGELLAQELVIKSALQVMHPRIEKTFAMQSNPKPHRAQFFLLR